MGQKFARYDESGNIIAYYDDVDSPVPEGVKSVIEISDSEWQACISAQGYKVHAGSLIAPPAPTETQLLAQLQVAQLALITEECRAAIVGGFTSAALGTVHAYPSADTDQRNLLSAVTASMMELAGWETSLWCAGLAWSFAVHTAEQVQQVNADWLTFRVNAQQKYADLQARIYAAESIEGVQAITWE